MHLVYVWENLGPYHVARMNALGAQPNTRVTVVERFRRIELRKWHVAPQGTNFQWLVQHDQSARARMLLPEALALAALIDDLSPDIVLWGTGVYGRLELLVVSLLRRRGVPSLAHFVSTAADRRTGGPAHHLAKGLLLKAYAGYLPVGLRQLDYLLSLGVSAERCTVTGNPVDNAAFAESGQEQLPSSLRAGGYFLYVGRFADVKNLATLVDAYAAYHASADRPWQLVLVGSGPTEQALRGQIARLGLPGEYVVLLPFTQGERLAALYHHAGCFVLPSTSEPWGLVVNEATAAGLPLLLSNRCGCLPHLLREPDNGFSFAPDDRAGLTSLLLRVSSDQLDRAAMGTVSRALAEGQSLERYGEAVANACRRRLERGRA